MTFNSLLAFVAALCGAAVAVAVLFQKRRSIASWCFFAGMWTLAIQSAFAGMSLEAVLPGDVLRWQNFALGAESFLPGIWLCFSLIYSRGNYREFLIKWQFLLAAACLLPVSLAVWLGSELLNGLHQPEAGLGWWVRFGPGAKALNIMLLIVYVLILMNLEKTFLAAVGTMRWRIKFAALGLAVIFGARIFTRSQALIFSGHNLALTAIESGALLIGCALLAVSFLRSGLAGIDVYPSRAVLQTSVTLVLAGAYLLVIGLLAPVVARFGGVGNFQAQAMLLLLALVVLSVAMLSDRVRLGIHRFVSRHFKRPYHDSRKVWTAFTREMSSVMDQSELCSVAARLISKTFDVLSVTIWLIDEPTDQLHFGASTSEDRPETSVSTALGSMSAGLGSFSGPFDLERVRADWGENLRQLNPGRFPHGGNRLCIPLVAGNRLLGLAILADRVNGVPYTEEELDLLKCIGDQVAAALLNLRLAREQMQAKELEAFQTMSAVFVHDLKNAAYGLNLMLQNLPLHFDDPLFREDALRAVSGTVSRMNHLTARLGTLRKKLELRPVESDLNQLVMEAIDGLGGVPEVELVKQLEPLPKVVADREQMQSVVTNLLLNARDALDRGGRVNVQTSHHNGRVVLSITDNGCGMSPEFLRDSLFRPFQTTKQKGLGIGMFQARMVVEAHRGKIEVESALGKGTTFRIILPLNPQEP